MEPRDRKSDNRFLYQLHKRADEPRKRAEECECEGPRFYRKPKDTTRRSSIEFYKLWH